MTEGRSLGEVLARGGEDERRAARRLVAAVFASLDSTGETADLLGISPATVRRWREVDVPEGWTPPDLGTPGEAAARELLAGDEPGEGPEDVSAGGDGDSPAEPAESERDRRASSREGARSEPPPRRRGSPPASPGPKARDIADTPFEDFGPEHREPLSRPAAAEAPSDMEDDRHRGPKVREDRNRPPGPRPEPSPEPARGGLETTRRVAFVLHAHLPWVLGHGSWPHGEDWLSEAVIHSYLPLVAALRRLGDDGGRHLLTLSITPVLALQLDDPRPRAPVERRLDERLDAAGELRGTHPLAEWWGHEIETRRREWSALDGDLVAALRRLANDEVVELSTSALTHAYLPLAHRMEHARFQLRAGVHLHRRLFGRDPEGAWLPECAYRPSGPWSHPATAASDPDRPGLESVLEDSGIGWTVVDTHAVLGGDSSLGYGFPWSGDPGREVGDDDGASLSRRLRPLRIGDSPVVAFAREPTTARQVWARQGGYPGDPSYLDFHKRHHATGLRLWRVTDSGSDLADKLPYLPGDAREAVDRHAGHFAELLAAVPGLDGEVATCPYDAELFGHWWYEGPRWLETVLEAIRRRDDLTTTTPALEIDRVPVGRRAQIRESSWGEGSDHRVWTGPATRWMWSDLRRAEEAVATALRAPLPRGWKGAILGQLSLMAASDWPFLVSMGTAADYASERFTLHHERLRKLLSLPTGAALPDWVASDLAGADLDPEWWSTEHDAYA